MGLHGTAGHGCLDLCMLRHQCSCTTPQQCCLQQSAASPQPARHPPGSGLPAWARRSHTDSRSAVLRSLSPSTEPQRSQDGDTPVCPAWLHLLLLRISTSRGRSMDHVLSRTRRATAISPSPTACHPPSRPPTCLASPSTTPISLAAAHANPQTPLTFPVPVCSLGSPAPALTVQDVAKGQMLWQGCRHCLWQQEIKETTTGR